MISLVLTAALAVSVAPASPAVVKPIASAKAAVRAEPNEPILQSVAVTLECTARTDGRVENCRVLGETHPGLGFAETAIALMQDAEVAAGPRDFQFARTIQFMP